MRVTSLTASPARASAARSRATPRAHPTSGHGSDDVGTRRARGGGKQAGLRVLALGTLCLTLSASFAATAAPARTRRRTRTTRLWCRSCCGARREKKEARTREELDDYNRRNFKDYFDGRGTKGYNGRTVTENDEAIRAQLDRWNRGK